MKRWSSILDDTHGYAIVEATILFPIIIMIFAGICLLSIYLPTRTNLQQATQYAANVMATQKSDTWIEYNTESMEYTWIARRKDIRNVYRSLFRSSYENEAADIATVTSVVTEREKQGIYIAVGNLQVTYTVTNAVVYQEMHVTATRTIKVPINLSFVGFPKEIPITVTSSAVMVNGDEFVRDIDLAKDFTEYLSKKYNLDKMFSSVSDVISRFNDVMGI